MTEIGSKHESAELDYDPVLAEPVIYRDLHGRDHAALVTWVIDADTVHLIVFADELHHSHVTAKAIAHDATGPGWFPSEA